MKLITENVMTDLRKLNVKISKELFDILNSILDIDKSEVYDMLVMKWQDVKGRTVLYVDDSGNAVALYHKDKFLYNTQKVKISQSEDWDLKEIKIQGVHVQNRREERKGALSGMMKTRDSSLPNLPKSTAYVFSKDYDPDVNRVYYSKLLQQKNLGRYAQQLNDAYDVVKELIDQRRERLTGKRSEYDRMITDISRQITKIEDEMVASERDFSVNPDKLVKELSKLPRLIQNARDFIDYENQEYARSGKRKPIPVTKIQR